MIGDAIHIGNYVSIAHIMIRSDFVSQTSLKLLCLDFPIQKKKTRWQTCASLAYKWNKTTLQPVVYLPFFLIVFEKKFGTCVTYLKKTALCTQYCTLSSSQAPSSMQCLTHRFGKSGVLGFGFTGCFQRLFFYFL
jgi:hypothetical protein